MPEEIHAWRDLLLKQTLGKGSPSHERIILALAGSRLRSFMTSLAPLSLSPPLSSSRFSSDPFPVGATSSHPWRGDQYPFLGSLLTLHFLPHLLHFDPGSAWCTDLHLQCSPPSQLRITSCHLPIVSSINTPNSTCPKPDSLSQSQGPANSSPYLRGLVFLCKWMLTFCLLCWLFSGCSVSFHVFASSHILFLSGMHLFIIFWLSEFSSLSKSLIIIFRQSFLELQSKWITSSSNLFLQALFYLK